jgi:hypothetical protein
MVEESFHNIMPLKTRNLPAGYAVERKILPRLYGGKMRYARRNQVLDNSRASKETFQDKIINNRYDYLCQER